MLQKNCRLGSHCVARVPRVVASGVGGFAKANILILSVGLRSAPPNLRHNALFQTCVYTLADALPGFLTNAQSLCLCRGAGE
uniref:hypothetical protein n=1 Tax=uncultured Nostoc sp. TaxID=340711 RepID=UPI0035C9E421